MDSRSVAVGLCGVDVASKVSGVQDNLDGLVEVFPVVLFEPFARGSMGTKA